MNGHDKSRPLKMFEDQMGTRLTGLPVTLPQKESKKFSGLRHLVDGERNCFRVNCSSGGNRFAVLLALLDVEAHGFEDAALGSLNCPAKTVDSWKIIAVGVVLPALFFNRDRIAV